MISTVAGQNNMPRDISLIIKTQPGTKIAGYTAHQTNQQNYRQLDNGCPSNVNEVCRLATDYNQQIHLVKNRPHF